MGKGSGEMDKKGKVIPQEKGAGQWMLRILLVLLVLLALLPSAAWFFFPWYAQSLVNRALEGKPVRIEVSGAELRGFSSIGFRSIKGLFTTPPNACSDAASYTFALTDGLISWHFENLDTPVSGALLPTAVKAVISIDADSLTMKLDPEKITFGDRKPQLHASIHISRKNGFTITFTPLSVAYTINGATVTREKLRLEDMNFTMRLNAAEHWQQKMDTLQVAKLLTDGNPSPVGKFKALFGSKPDPLKPCTLTLTGCSMEFFHWKASTERLDYDLKNKQSRFTLIMSEIPLAEIPGFNRGGSKTPFASGRITGMIPVEFKDSTVLVRNAGIIAEKGTGIVFYSRQNKPLLSLNLEGNEVVNNLNARIILNSRNKKLSGLAISDLSATVLGGTITSTPINFDPLAHFTLLTLKLNKIMALERMGLYGDFKSSLKGPVSGTIPLAITNKGFSIRNAHLQSTGGGSITIVQPRKEQRSSERIFGMQKQDAKYTFKEPDIVLSRSLNGSTTMTFTLKNLLCKTNDREMQFTLPSGKLMLWHNRLNFDIASLSDFSAGFFDGTVAIRQFDYDMAKKKGETTIRVNNIPLQKLLDLQGTKKIYATGSAKGAIPIKINGSLFEITDGGMNAEQSGQIIYATTPEERAAANQGLRTTYEALSNFLYVELLSSINMTPDGNSTMTIKIKGTNPEFQAGRPIELNLNIQQNLLDLMRSLSVSSDIEQMITEKALQKRKK
jgi:hypothetical protein